jgi:hypothetical protein
MTTQTEVLTNGEKHEEKATDRDLQRQALRGLVILSEQCAADEADIEKRHDTGFANEAQAYERATWAADQNAKGVEESIKQKYEERLGKIQAQFDSDTAAIREAHEKGKRKVQVEFTPQEQEIKKKYDEALWLADAELEARQNQIRLEQKKANEDLKTHGEEIDDLEGRAISLLKTYRHKPTDQDMSQMATAEGEKPEPGNYPAKRDAALAELSRLQSLFAPQLMVGARPFMIALVLLAIAGGAAWFKNMDKAFDFNDYIVPCGAALGIAVVLAVIFMMVGKSAVRKTWTRTKKHLDESRKASRVDHENTLKELEARTEAAKQKRATEAAALKEKYSPRLSAVQEKKKAALGANEVQTTARMKTYEEKRQGLVKETEAWQVRHQEELKVKLAKQLENLRIKHEAKMKEIEDRYQQEKADLEKRWKDGLVEVSKPMQESDHEGLKRTVYDWEGTNWEKWAPPKSFTTLVRFGELQVDLKTITDQYPRHLALPEAFAVPANLAFPRQSSLLIHADREGRGEAVAALQMVMSRLLTSLPPGRVKFTIIDPVGLGQSFAGFMHLADHDESLVGGRIWTEREQIDQRLLNLTEHMETVIQKYLRNEYETIDEYNAQAGELAEPYRYLVIADFPVGFEGDSFRRLASIATSGARCGVYTLMIRDTRIPMPQGSHFDDLEAHSVNLVRIDGKYVWKDEVFKQFPLKLDVPPSEDTLTDMMDVVGREARHAARVEVPFWQIAPKEEKDFWTKSAKSLLSVPVGRLGATKVQSLAMGKGVAQHALVAGKTGSGKSTLLHAIVTNIAMWYRPDEVELYLIDFKKGVEFKTYASNELPHARAIAVESDREFGLSVLQRLDMELTRRGEIFRKLGVQDLASYRDTPGTGPMPRTLLIIDEFQEFFSEDDKLAQDSALLIDRLVRQGRAFGVHVFLGSQTIGGSGGLSRATLGQMAIRIALQTSEADSQLILGDGNSAARLLTRPGEAIYNDAGGLVEANSPFQVAWLPDEQRDEFLTKVLDKTKRENAFYGEPAVVFEGNAPADITKNRALIKLLEQGGAKQTPTAPLAWMGEPVAIKDPTGIPMRRQSGSNVLIVGQADELAQAIMVSGMVALAAQHPKGTAIFYVLDGTPADAPFVGTFDKIREILPHEVKMVDFRAVPEAINELAEEQTRRQGSENLPEAPEIYVFIYGLQRYRPLRKTEETFGGFGSSGDEEKKTPPDKQFADLLREGPPLGIHTITWCDTPASLERTLDRGSMREFDNRLLFQMSANDSSNLIDSPAGNKLGMFRALAYSEEQGVFEKFRPYGMVDKNWLDYLRSKFVKS